MLEMIAREQQDSIAGTEGNIVLFLWIEQGD
jgi:hypothetical protein